MGTGSGQGRGKQWISSPKATCFVRHGWVRNGLERSPRPKWKEWSEAKPEITAQDHRTRPAQDFRTRPPHKTRAQAFAQALPLKGGGMRAQGFFFIEQLSPKNRPNDPTLTKIPRPILVIFGIFVRPRRLLDPRGLKIIEQMCSTQMSCFCCVFHLISGEDSSAEEKQTMLQRPSRKKIAGIPPCFSLDFWRGSAGRVEKSGSQRQTQNRPGKTNASIPPCCSLDFGGGSAGKGEKIRFSA